MQNDTDHPIQEAVLFQRSLGQLRVYGALDRDGEASMGVEACERGRGADGQAELAARLRVPLERAGEPACHHLADLVNIDEATEWISVQ